MADNLIQRFWVPARQRKQSAGDETRPRQRRRSGGAETTGGWDRRWGTSHRIVVRKGMIEGRGGLLATEGGIEEEVVVERGLMVRRCGSRRLGPRSEGAR
jgi:hypothetical protein